MHIPPDSNSSSWPGFRGLYDRVNGEIVDASPEDVALAHTYPQFAAKGKEVGGRRLTLLTPRSAVKVGEEVHVLHFYEISQAGGELYIMGPKEVFGEVVDGKLVGNPPEVAEYPWIGEYDGEVMPSPGVDYNFAITKYRFDQPGQHTVRWQIGGLASNVITLTVQ